MQFTAHAFTGRLQAAEIRISVDVRARYWALYSEARLHQRFGYRLPALIYNA